MLDNSAALERYADLVTGFALNLQPGQVVTVDADLGHEVLARAVTASAYRRGARFVDVSYFDVRAKRERLLWATDESLSFVPAWYGERLLELGRQRGARVRLTGPVDPDALRDVDPLRAGRDQLPKLPETSRLANERTTNWTVVPCPTPAWAALVFPGLAPEAAWRRLGEQLTHVCRLDEADPQAAWRARTSELTAVAERLTARRLSAVRFRGQGTDLTVGLLPASRWMTARFETVDGIEHLANLPSEEVFTTPDPLRADGVVRSTKPLLLNGSLITGLTVEFREGRVVRVDAVEGADVLRGYVARDEGAQRLGELALVDRQSRIGSLGTVFYDTLVDENAASHLALGNAIAFTVDKSERERANRSSIHVDFMVGSPAVRVDGIDGTGTESPLLHGETWCL